MALSVPCVTRASFLTKAELLLANAAIATIFIVWTALLLPVAWLLLPFCRLVGCGGRRFLRQAAWCYGRGLLILLRPFIPAHCARRNLARTAAPCIIVANHQSFLDLFLLGAQNERDLCLVSKAWPYRLLFFFAPVMRTAGYIDAESLLPAEVERRALQCLSEGATLVIFPEGRRTRDGGLGRFHVGAFHLACRAGVPVLPLAILNSFSVFRVGSRCFRPGPVALRMLEPVFPREFSGDILPHRVMMRRVRAELQDVLTSFRPSEMPS